MIRTGLTGCGLLNQHYLYRIEETIGGALELHPRLMVVRIDLRLPNNGSYSENTLEQDSVTSFANTGVNIVKRFMSSLRAQIAAEADGKKKAGARVHQCELNYIWAREYSQKLKEHYHVALTLNKDRYFSLGDYKKHSSLAGMIIKAWASALGMLITEVGPLVHFPKNPVYHLDHNASHEEYTKQICLVLMRLSYLAKENSKVYGTGNRNFGCSKPQKKSF